jgi:hypothetical protein
MLNKIKKNVSEYRNAYILSSVVMSVGIAVLIKKRSSKKS